MLIKKLLTLLLIATLSNATFAQDKKQLSSSEAYEDIVMTWNKNTPESEMKDDVKALSDVGITIKYSNVKRNSKDEITGLKVEYSDRKGNKGKMELENATPIATIKFFKQGDTVGFGEPSNGNNLLAGNSMLNGFGGAEDLMKQFKFDGNGSESQSFSFNFPDQLSFGDTETRIQIQKDGKKPLVFQNGEIVEGGDDYSKEELEKIKSENKIENFGRNNNSFGSKEFDFRNQEGLDNFKKKMDEMKIEMEKKFSYSSDSNKYNSDLEKTKDEMIKAKDEMNKAKEELEKAKKDLEKAKTSIKTKKA